MTSITRYTREILDVAAKAGVKVVELERGKKNIRILVERSGKRGLVFASITPSDWRSMMNIVRDMKAVTR